LGHGKMEKGEDGESGHRAAPGEWGVSVGRDGEDVYEKKIDGWEGEESDLGGVGGGLEGFLPS